MCSFVFSPALNLVFYLNFCLQLAGCVGDFHVVRVLRRFSADVLVCDTGVGMTFYEPEVVE